MFVSVGLVDTSWPAGEDETAMQAVGIDLPEEDRAVADLADLGGEVDGQVELDAAACRARFAPAEFRVSATKGSAA
jgi:hypothetical protein